MNKMNPVNRLGVSLLTSAMIATSGIATAAVSSGISPVIAYAVPGNGSVTITQQGNAEARYDAFQIVSADVTKGTNATTGDDEYLASHLNWSSLDMQTAVVGFLGTIDDDNVSGGDYDAWLYTKYNTDASGINNTVRNLAQNAVEYISERIQADADAANTSTTPPTKQGDSFAARLSRYLYSYDGNNDGTPDLTPDDTVLTGTSKSLQQGYWLITSKDETIAPGEVGTAPIFAAISDTALEINAKEAVPVINKYVRDDAANAEYGKIADAGVGEVENLGFKIVADLPQNIDAYHAYAVSVSDVLPAGMDLQNSNTSSVDVLLNGESIKDKLVGTAGSISYAGGTLTVSITDVKDATTLGVDTLDNTDNDGGCIEITYNAHLTGSANIGTTTGNVNAATITYSADPNDASITQTAGSTANIVTYEFEIEKVDEVTRLPLQHAKFVVSTQIGSPATTYYVKADGTLTDDATQAAEFETDANGLVSIPRLDEGTYTIHETAAPDHYELETNDATLTITATKDIANGTLSALTASLSGWKGTFVNGEVSDISQDGVKPTSTATTDGILKGRLSNTLQIVLPLTGMPVKTAVLYGGIAIAVTSVVAYGVSKKVNNKEQE